MGSCNNIKSLSEKNKELDDNKTKLSDILKLYPIGKGGFGKVWKASNKKNKKIYAFKQMSKLKLYKKMMINSINEELEILKSLNDPSIANIHYAFQNEEHVFILMDYFAGGDLRNLIMKRKNRHFNEDELKFIISNILIGLKYLRENHVIHRDIKPENLIFDDEGYLHLSDFGISKRVRKENKIFNKCGTLGYVSPETLLNTPQSYQSDYFSLGVVLHELIFGMKPYNSHNKMTYKTSILCKKVNITPKDLPKYTKYEDKLTLCSFINSLLERKDSRRLGANSIDEIINHPWLKNINWQSLVKHEIVSPFKNDCFQENNLYSKNINLDSSSEDDIIYNNINKILNDINHKFNYFSNFYYNEDEHVLKRDAVTRCKNDSNLEKNKDVRRMPETKTPNKNKRKSVQAKDINDLLNFKNNKCSSTCSSTNRYIKQNTLSNRDYEC